MATRDSLRASNMVMEIEPSSCGKLFFHTISGTSSASKNRDDLLVDLGEVNGDAEERETPTEAGIGGLMSVPARSSILPTVNLIALSGCRTLMIDREVFINDQSLLSLFIEDTPNDIDHVVIEHGQHQILIRIAGDGHPMFNFSNGYRQIKELVDQDGAAMFCFLNFEFGKIHILVFDVCGLEVMYDHLWDYTIEDTRFPDARFENYAPPRWHRWR
nr:hypothetical protein Iba_chr01aCG13770 [Ipomoea batatas]GME18703.1 hypothetical protein Iba_scaffold21069CG0350 [Ipomoea batatas]